MKKIYRAAKSGIPSRRLIAGALYLLLLGAMSWGSERLTFTTSYPSPVGIYRTFITTQQTLLARDGGNVAIRLRGAAPVSPLDIGPQNAANEGAEIRFRGAGANRYFYLDNFAGNLRFVSQNAAGVPETVKLTVTNAGNVTVVGDLTANRVFNATYAP